MKIHLYVTVPLNYCSESDNIAFSRLIINEKQYSVRCRWNAACWESRILVAMSTLLHRFNFIGVQIYQGKSRTYLVLFALFMREEATFNITSIAEQRFCSLATHAWSFMPTTLECANILKTQVIKTDFAMHDKCLLSNAEWKSWCLAVAGKMKCLL